MGLLWREQQEAWLPSPASHADVALSNNAERLRATLQQGGALFFAEIVKRSGLLHTQAEEAMGELVAAGLATADSFAGLRALLVPATKRPPRDGHGRRRQYFAAGVEAAGRWSLVSHPESSDDDTRLEQQARTLLSRYGVVFRRLMERESAAAPWRELARIYRRLEARGEIRGGRFVALASGEQFALPEAVGMLRAVRKQAVDGAAYTLSAADPLNLAGILTSDTRIAATASNRVTWCDGVIAGP
jgi:ATP-dependent Lhr-like helicase